MVRFLSWVYVDDAALATAKRVINFFREKRIRDPLGVGQITTSLSNQLFPATSSVMTRLRYVFIVPWVYRLVESGGPSKGEKKFGETLEEAEKKLIKALSNNEDHEGVIGFVARDKVKTLPSELYWSVLRAWDIRRFRGTRNHYHRMARILLERRSAMNERREKAKKRGEEIDPHDALSGMTWDPLLPKPPEGFPGVLGLGLTFAESEYLLNRLKAKFPDSLLCALASKVNPEVKGIDQPWEHPAFGTFSADQRALLTQARYLAEIMDAAYTLYHYQLAGKKNNGDLVKLCKGNFKDWLHRFPEGEILSWDVNDLWDLTIGRGHPVYPSTKAFIGRFLGFVKSNPGKLLEDDRCLNLIRDREISLKGPRSRFRNAKALEEWSGDLSATRLTFRWATVRTLLNDLYLGLGQGALC